MMCYHDSVLLKYVMNQTTQLIQTVGVVGWWYLKQLFVLQSKHTLVSGSLWVLPTADHKLLYFEPLDLDKINQHDILCKTHQHQKYFLSKCISNMMCF